MNEQNSHVLSHAAQALRDADTAILKALDGKTVVYQERMTVGLVRLSHIRTEPETFRALATPTGPAGLHFPPQPWNFGARWGHFSVDSVCVTGGAYVNWRLHTTLRVVERVTELLANVARRSRANDAALFTPVEPKTIAGGLRVLGVMRLPDEEQDVYNYLKRAYREESGDPPEA